MSMIDDCIPGVQMPCALEVICMTYEQIKKRKIKKLHNWMTHISWFSTVKLFIFVSKSLCLYETIE